jgi:hypothetical protein
MPHNAAAPRVIPHRPADVEVEVPAGTAARAPSEPLTPERIAAAFAAAERRLSTAPPSVEYPIEALGPLAPVARAIADGAQVRPAMAGQSVLGAAALLVQHRHDVRALDGRRPLSLYFLTIGDSGDGKTAAERPALAPIRDWQRAQTDAYRAALAEHEAAPPKGRGDPPRAPYRIAKDATVEGIRQGFAAGIPTQGVYTSEAASLLCGYGMSADQRMKTASTLNGLWDDGELSVSRSITGRIQLYDRRLSVHWLIQPSAAQDTLHDASLSNLGFWPRFLAAWPDPPRPKVYRDWRPESDPAIGTYWRRATELLAEPIGDDCARLPAIESAPEARARAGRFFEAMEREARTAGARLEAVRPFALRATEQAYRIAGVLSAYAGRREIDDATMRGSIALALYSVDTWRGIFGDRDEARAHTQALALYRWLLTRPGAAASTTAILSAGPRCVRSRSARDTATAVLEGASLAVRDHDTWSAVHE